MIDYHDDQEKYSGLTKAHAKALLQQHGSNEISDQSGTSFLGTMKEILTEPMLLLLLTAAVVYIIIGDLAEGLLLCAFASGTIGLVIYQERRSENALAALRSMAEPHATVVRDGEKTVIPAHEIVPGDLVIVDEGERMPADGIVVKGNTMLIDESLLTGESVPVRKCAIRSDEDEIDSTGTPGGEDQPFVFSGTLIVGGHGLVKVTNTGSNTQAGAIGASLISIDPEKTRLQQSTARIVRLFGIAALFVCLALVIWIGLLEGDWVQGILSGIALAMAMLPEEFPVALAIILAIGAWRLSQIDVLARRPAVVETLGAATVLCVDKTGTLTENRMRVAALANDKNRIEMDGLTEAPVSSEFANLIETAYLAARRGSYDPMDAAVTNVAKMTVSQSLQRYGQWPLVREYGITPDLLAFSQIWRDDGGDLFVATKGAPEAVAELCRLDKKTHDAIMKQVAKLAESGLRVLAVARAKVGSEKLADDPHAYEFVYLGLLGFQDPLRKSAPDAVSKAQAAGISVKMITGDYPATAMTIAAQAGIDVAAGYLTGGDVANLRSAELRQAVKKTNVFARMMPQQKLRLVRALKDNGEIVAMTGDGVNDAPALKAAHIGIAMGERGTDVAREAAGIVLLNENFGTIVSAVRMGRKIFDNLRKVMIYITAIHVPIAGLALLPLVFGWPPLFLPMHVVLIEMIIDPMCSVAYETTPAEPKIMAHPPRPIDDPMIGGPQLAIGFVYGLLLLAVSLVVYWTYIQSGVEVDLARTLTFIALTTANVGLARVSASRNFASLSLLSSGYRSFWVIAILATITVSACILHPTLSPLFGFATPSIAQLATALGAGLACVLIIDMSKSLKISRRILG